MFIPAMNPWSPARQRRKGCHFLHPNPWPTSLESHRHFPPEAGHRHGRGIWICVLDGLGGLERSKIKVWSSKWWIFFGLHVTSREVATTFRIFPGFSSLGFPSTEHLWSAFQKAKFPSNGSVVGGGSYSVLKHVLLVGQLGIVLEIALHTSVKTQMNSVIFYWQSPIVWNEKSMEKSIEVSRKVWKFEDVCLHMWHMWPFKETVLISFVE